MPSKLHLVGGGSIDLSEDLDAVQDVLESVAGWARFDVRGSDRAVAVQVANVAAVEAMPGR
jgi:hypothetical protein